MEIIVSYSKLIPQNMKYWIALFVVIFSLTCYGQENNISESDLIGCWTHSREEDKANSEIMVYRPCDYKEFPASRYRHKFELKENGECSLLSLASNDAHSMAKGTWTYESKNQIIEIFDEQGESINKFSLIEFNEKTMKLKDYQAQQ